MVILEPSKNSINIESVVNSVSIEVIAIESEYYFLHPAQIEQKNKEAGT